MTAKKKSNFLIFILIVVGDAVVIYLSLLLAYWVRFHTFIPIKYGIPPLNQYLQIYPLATLVILVSFRTFGLYKRQWALIGSSEIVKIAKATVAGIAAMIIIDFVYKHRENKEYSTVVALISIVIIVCLVSAFRKSFQKFEVWFFRKQGLDKKLVILGTNEKAEKLAETIQTNPQLCYNIVGVLSESKENQENTLCGIPVIGSLTDIQSILVNGKVDEAILCLPDLEHETKSRIVLQCEKEYIDLRLIPDLYEILTSNLQVVNVNGIPLMSLPDFPLDSAWNRFVKRVEDIIGSTIGLILFSPVFLIISVLIKKDSSGPAFYKQERCSLDGNSFTLLKFRTMKDKAEDETGPVWATSNDPRVTKIGSRIRDNGLDELPQLINVFKGDMSLVGPRPERPYFIEQFRHMIPRYMSRHHIKSGLTGWAQVHGLRQNTSLEERIKYDIYYMENWSLLLDLKILLLTLFNKY